MYLCNQCPVVGENLLPQNVLCNEQLSHPCDVWFEKPTYTQWRFNLEDQVPFAKRALNSSLLAVFHSEHLIAFEGHEGSMEGGRGNLLTELIFFSLKMPFLERVTIGWWGRMVFGIDAAAGCCWDEEEMGEGASVKEGWLGCRVWGGELEEGEVLFVWFEFEERLGEDIGIRIRYWNIGGVGRRCGGYWIMGY